ncbi:MAG TPA: DUF192 domain-containing protein [Beijerinckiaceae bacterium]|nr:DUF192 domain-containing protein [Beijerinckiaceae bacterium]
MSDFVARGARPRCLGALAAVFLVAVTNFWLALVALPQTAQAQAQTRTQEGGLEPLDFVTANGTHRFSVEVMRTPAQLERGLMFRRFMPADRGMLFDFQVEQPVQMWMKNTYMSLDMVFIERNGTVASIAKNAEPLSERIIPSGAPVYAVVELNAGTADRIDLAPGDHVVQALFKP